MKLKILLSKMLLSIESAFEKIFLINFPKLSFFAKLSPKIFLLVALAKTSF